MASATLSSEPQASNMLNADYLIGTTAAGPTTNNFTRTLILTAGPAEAITLAGNSSSSVAISAAGAITFTPASGQVVSAAGWLQGSGTVRTTTAPTNATATLSSGVLSDLSVTLIAGRKYAGVLTLVAKNSTAAEGLQVDFGGGTATFTSFRAGFAAIPPGAPTLGVVTTTSPTVALTATSTVVTTDLTFTIPFALVCNAAGTLIPRFAEVSHTTGTVTVEINSCMIVEDCTN